MLSKSLPSVQAVSQWHAIASSLVKVANWSIWINLTPLVPIRMVLLRNVGALQFLKRKYVLKYISQFPHPFQVPLNKKDEGIPHQYLKRQFDRSYASLEYPL